MKEVTPTLDEAIGASIRRFRTTAGIRAEDVARMMNVLGVDWLRNTVTAVERGKRKVSAGELIVLLSVLDMSPEELLVDPAAPDQLIRLAGNAFIDSASLAASLASVPSSRNALEKISAQVMDRYGFDLQQVADEIGASGRPFDDAVGDLSDEIQYFVWRSGSDADARAAQKFGVDIRSVTLASRYLWRRSLEEERAARVRVDPNFDPRTLSGHVTRSLHNDIGKALKGTN